MVRTSLSPLNGDFPANDDLEHVLAGEGQLPLELVDEDFVVLDHRHRADRIGPGALQGFAFLERLAATGRLAR